MLPSKRAAYSDLFEKMLDPIFLLNTETYRVLELNPAAERLMENQTGRDILEFVPEKELRVAARRFHPRLFEAQWNQLCFEAQACKLELSDKSEVLQLILRDITARKNAENLVKEMAIRDEMTGLFNYRYFSGQLEHEHQRASRYGDQYALVFFDIDHFKHYNDRNGHQAGDDLLREVAKVIQSCVRTSDVLARYGGEEFVVLCPSVDWNGAMILAERIRAAIAKSPLSHAEAQPLGHLSVSIGVAGYPAHGKTAKEILDAADQAMYRSKKGGRNRVSAA